MRELMPLPVRTRANSDLTPKYYLYSNTHVTHGESNVTQLEEKKVSNMRLTISFVNKLHRHSLNYLINCPNNFSYFCAIESGL